MIVREALEAATAALDAAGCGTPRLDAELLIADALDVARERLFLDPDMEIPPAAARVIAESVRRRNEREPVAYILGRKGFRNIELMVDRRVLVPRPESEMLVEAALDLPEGARVHDVGTGSGAIALALLDERPDLQVSASEVSPDAVDVARENAARLGLPLEVEVADGLPPGDYDLVIANLPYVRDDRWDGLMPEINRYEPRVAITSGTEGHAFGHARCARAPSRPGGRDPRAAGRTRLLPRPRELGPHHRRPRAVTREEVETFERCIAVGGVALFPADTVYGLATEPDSRDGVDRLYRLKGRAPDTPAAVMFFDLDLALAAVPELGPRTRGAVERLLPGALTLLVPNPARRYPLACGPEPERLGLRVPLLDGELAPLAAVSWPVLQSSANRSGEPDASRIADVDEQLRAGVDLILDGGELPGTPSTVVDLGAYESDGSWEVVREGAVPREAVVRCLR
jgi:L-threonylcarbamoyladenylate synthase